MTQLIVIFAIAQLINVMLSTAKSLFTIKGGWVSASVMNAITYGFYTYVIVLTANADFSTNIKAIITVIVNFVGVAVVKAIEKKMQKDKLWVFNATVKEDNENLKAIVKMLKEMNIKCIYNEVTESLYTMQIFSNTQNESVMIKGILDNYNVKYYATETVC